MPEAEHFEGRDLASDRWVPWYLPPWSSRESSRATYDVASSVLRLRIPTTQGLWCADRHSPALRTSTIASGLYVGPLGSTVGQQPFADGLTVSEEQHPFRGWLVEGGTVTVRARADLTARSMVSVWLVGFEDEPDRCGEVCVFEVFGDTVTASSAGVGAGVHAFRDPALREDFSVTPVDLELRVGRLDAAAPWAARIAGLRVNLLAAQPRRARRGRGARRGRPAGPRRSHPGARGIAAGRTDHRRLLRHGRAAHRGDVGGRVAGRELGGALSVPRRRVVPCHWTTTSMPFPRTPPHRRSRPTCRPG